MGILIGGAGVLKFDDATHGEKLVVWNVMYIVRRSRRRSRMRNVMI
jgi:hypothetical protein